ncbi:MAG: prolipoprotein diacylglyceryl transferase [Clostridiales bacterium]|nr:prolipoprotein diacylglyceryl transferase [Clostridiales bacterium]
MSIPYGRMVFGNLSWYSVLIVFGMLLAIFLASKEEARIGLPKDTVIDLALIVIPFGIIGARIYYVLMKWELFASNLISVLYIWEGGLAIYGGVIGGAIGALIYAKRKKLSFPKLVDIIVPGVILAQAIGRWGNYFNMEAYGPVITDPMFCFFPLGVQIQSGGVWAWHMATFFYESLWNFCGFAVLWSIRKKQKQSGNVFCWYLLIYGSGRFIIEQLREDSLYIGSVRASQMLSLVLCLAAGAVLLWRAANGKKLLFGVGALASVLLIARWGFLDQYIIYAALLLVAVICCAWAIKASGNVKMLGSLAIITIVDIIGLVAYHSGKPLTGQFALMLHTVVCSATLPMFIGLLCGALDTNTQ